MTEAQFSINRELLNATKQNDTKAIQLLLTQGADPSVYQSEPVRNIISNNNLEALNSVIDSGYNLNSNGAIAYKQAIKENNNELLNFMILQAKPEASVLVVAKTASDEIKKIINKCFNNNILTF